MELNLDFVSGFGDMGFANSSNVDSVWDDLSYEAKDTTTGEVSEGTLWYNSDLKIEILKMYLTVHKWNGLNMHGQKTIDVFIKRITITYWYVQLVKMEHPLQTGDLWVDGDEMPIRNLLMVRYRMG